MAARVSKEISDLINEISAEEKWTRSTQRGNLRATQGTISVQKTDVSKKKLAFLDSFFSLSENSERDALF